MWQASYSMGQNGYCILLSQLCDDIISHHYVVTSAIKLTDLKTNHKLTLDDEFESDKSARHH